jgi:phosphate transport system substrate-binding protein
MTAIERVTCWLAVVAIGCGCAAAPVEQERELTVRGSDTMLILNRQLAASFMRANPGVSILVRGGGTGVGVEALVAGESDICAASRPLAADEVRAIYDRFGTLGVRFLIAQDALSVYVNRQNPIRNLTTENLRQMFEGTLESWADVGGGAVPVVAVVRPPSSGTHRFFRDHVLLGRPYTISAVTAPSTNGVLEQVASQVGGIGYGGVAYRAEGVVHCAVDGVEPTVENVRRGDYPLTRHLAFYTVDPPRGLEKRFIDWCLGEEGQSVVAEVGYIPLWPG